MNAVEIVNAVVVVVGVPTIITFLVGFGRKLELLDQLRSKIEKNIVPDLKDIRERFGGVDSKVATLWQDRYAPQSSPRKLNELGQKVFETSGIKNIVDRKKKKLLEAVRAKGATNAYDAERRILEVMLELPTHCPDVIDELKNGAYKAGSDFDGVLFVGSIYLRDLIFDDLGFSLDDIDKENDKNKKLV